MENRQFCRLSGGFVRGRLGSRLLLLLREALRGFSLLPREDLLLQLLGRRQLGEEALVHTEIPVHLLEREARGVGDLLERGGLGGAAELEHAEEPDGVVARVRKLVSLALALDVREDGHREEGVHAAGILGRRRELRGVLPADVRVFAERLDEAVEDLSLLVVGREPLEELVVHGHEPEGGELGVAVLGGVADEVLVHEELLHRHRPDGRDGERVGLHELALGVSHGNLCLSSGRWRKVKDVVSRCSEDACRVSREGTHVQTRG